MSKKFDEVAILIEDMIVDLKQVDNEYLTDKEYEAMEDKVYESPRYVTTDKNGHFHLEYVMMSIEKGGTICSKGLGEDWGDAKVLTVDDLSWGDVIAMHDITFPEQ